MDPVGPWSAYASYNRIAGVQAGTPGTAAAATASADLHHHLASSGAPGAPSTTATAQLLSGSFLSPPPVGYDGVFGPLFHHAGTKPPTHYVAQHRQALAQVQVAGPKQANDNEYHQAQTFFDQGGNAWQQNSPFGILPHESVVTSSPSTKPTTTTYENFNAHFVAAQSLNQLNSQIVAANAAKIASRVQTPQIVNSKSPANQPATAFFQASANATGYATTPGEAPQANKYANNSSGLQPPQPQQSCIVSSPPNSSTVAVATKDYRAVPQARSVFLTTPNANNAARPTSIDAKQQVASAPQIQTKAQTKVYPELADRSCQPNSDETPSQSPPVSFSVDSSGRINYSSNATKRASQFSNHQQQQHSAAYRHYPGNSSETEFQRPKSGSDFSNGADCGAVVPRRPSPLQAHSQSSPLGHVPSPVYPIYNSPLNSLSSPQNANHQVTPPSPLDVSVSRSNQNVSNTVGVAYPSVITRALNNNEKSVGTAPAFPNNQNLNCWDDRTKRGTAAAVSFPVAQGNTSYTNSSAGEQQQRQQTSTYFDNSQQQQQQQQHQVTLQDLSSCRGDPMSIVKNLQQQQSCQVQQVEIKQETKGKRRKSNEKGDVAVSTTVADYFVNRIPPPAHSSVSNSQQQQNGTYFDFDSRWIPPPAAKMFGPQAIHQQHQGLMVSHPHHPPPPLPYFPPFHLPPTEYPSSVETNAVNAYGEPMSSAAPESSQYIQQHQHSQQQAVQQQTQQQSQENPPKVVVPNIEEELNFLSKTPSAATVTSPSSTLHTANSSSIPVLKSDKRQGPTDGFMNSYLKFLQGERDSSPPPTSRGNRKQTWSRAKPQSTLTDTVIKQEGNDNSSAVASLPPNGILTSVSTLVSTPSLAPQRLSQGDPQDDPRYFPLPKERKRNYFDSSDDGFSSEEDLFAKKVSTVIKSSDNVKEKAGRKGRPPKTISGGVATERKRARKTSNHQIKQFQPRAIKIEADGKDLPRRESSKRAAKEKTNFNLKQSDEDYEEPAEFLDSDSDPAWTPQARDDGEEELLPKRGKKSRPGPRRKTSSSKNFSYQGSVTNIGGVQDENKRLKMGFGNKQSQSAACKFENSVSSIISQQNNGVIAANKDEFQYKEGEFLVIKSELSQLWPSIWRVDGKELLQKFEPFQQNGRTVYRNISTYTSWNSESSKQYVPVPVKYCSMGQKEIIVELLRSEVVYIDNNYLQQVLKDSAVYQDNFEVYIQTLISQALDSNFLTEIFQEQDDYFLTNVKTIDDITESKRLKMVNLLCWPDPVRSAVSTWPCFNVIRELNLTDSNSRHCATCFKKSDVVRVLMYGQPYNATTLEGCPPNTQVGEKDFLMCRMCASQIELFNKIIHQKYLMYIECAKRVAEKRAADSKKDTTCILNELLADEMWLNQLFDLVRSAWAEVDTLEHSFQFKHSAITQ